MADLHVETPEGLVLRFELAGAGSRGAAALLDGLLWGIVMLTAFLFLLTLGGAGGMILWVVTGVLVSLAAYQIGFGVFLGGRTPGKLALGLRVTDEHGFPATPAQHFLRGLFWPLEAVVLLVPVPLGVVLIATTPRRQRLGDLVAGTVVLRELERGGAPEPFPRETWSGLERPKLGLVPALAARFDGEDLDYLRELFARTRMDGEARRKLVRKSARHYARRLGVELKARPSSHESGELLRELYLFLREMRAGSSATTRRPAAGGAGRGNAPSRARPAR